MCSYECGYGVWLFLGVWSCDRIRGVATRVYGGIGCVGVVIRVGVCTYSHALAVVMRILTKGPSATVAAAISSR